MLRMLREKLAPAVLSICVLGSAAAQAEEGYFGGSFANVDYSENGLDDNLSLPTIYGRLGWQLSENFSSEIRAGLGIGDDSIDVLGFETEIELDNFYGVYLRGGWKVTKSFFPYAILGYTHTELSGSIPGLFSSSTSDSDVSYGFGADMNLGEKMVLNVEYMNYFDEDAAKIEGFAVGIARRF